MKSMLIEDEDDVQVRKRRPRIGRIALVAILLVVVIGGGIVGSVYFVNQKNAAHPTPVVISTPTGTPLFSDAFTNNNAGWDTSNPMGGKISLGNGKLTLESDDNKIYQELLPGETFGDMRLDVDASLVSGNEANGYGVYIRGLFTKDAILGLYYSFEVYGDGSFVIYKGIQDTSGAYQRIILKRSSTADPAIYLKGRMNHLTVIAKGAQLTFMVNGTPLAMMKDESYKSGSVALFVSNVSNVPAGAQATFQHLAIFPTE